MIISEWQRYRYVANTSPRTYISGRYAFCNYEALEAVMSSEGLSIYMIECYVTSLRYHHSRDYHLSHAVRYVYVGVDIVA